MKTLNLYYSSTGNTGKVAGRIDQTLKDLGYSHDSLQANSEAELDVLEYDLVFVGSGVYAWLPGKPLQDLLTSLRKGYVKDGAIKPASPRLSGKKAVIYCTYGGAHTGINEAVPAVKYMAQLFDHLGFEILGEIYVVGEYIPENMREMSQAGRLGDIRGRPDEHDLDEVEQRVRGLVRI
jgi:flavodoxin